MKKIFSFIAFFLILSFALNSSWAQTSIPDWIKSNAGWWANGDIGDETFVQGIQYLIKEGIMQIPPTTPQGSSESTSEIPGWIKSNAGWWANGDIGDETFVQGIQYLIKEGILSIPSPSQNVVIPANSWDSVKITSDEIIDYKINGGSVSKVAIDESASSLVFLN